MLHAPSRALTSSVCLSHAPGARPVAHPVAALTRLRVVHALLLLPCVFWNFPIFSVNTYYIPKPYPPSTIRISSWFLLQIYRSPYYDSNKPYFITHYTIWTKISRFKGSVIWVFRYLRINVRFSLNSKLQWLKIITVVPPSSRLRTTTTIVEESFELPNTWVSFSFLCFLGFNHPLPFVFKS